MLQFDFSCIDSVKLLKYELPFTQDDRYAFDLCVKHLDLKLPAPTFNVYGSPDDFILILMHFESRPEVPGLYRLKETFDKL